MWGDAAPQLPWHHLGDCAATAKPFPVTLPQHNPCGTRITPKGFQLLQPWEKLVRELEMPQRITQGQAMQRWDAQTPAA